MEHNEAEKAADYFLKEHPGMSIKSDVKEAFIAGAEWQKERQVKEYETVPISDYDKAVKEIGRLQI